MTFLWLSWKDASHPQAGGAERILSELCQSLVYDGHHVTILTARYPGAQADEMIDGVRYIRVGRNRYLHSFMALAYYLRHLRDKFDVVIEVVNTAPYLSVLFGSAAKRILLYHQLARQVWFHETMPGVSHIGYFLLEPVATRLLAASRVATVAMSPSTKKDLQRFGFASQNVYVVRQISGLTPVSNPFAVKKAPHPTILSLGAMRSMKRTLDQLLAFELAKQQLPNLRFCIAGQASGQYGRAVEKAILRSPFASAITYFGHVTMAKKQELMRTSHLIAVTSVKEGWGLIVSEAASQGTPAVVYDVDGLRDSVRHGETGLVTAERPSALADAMVFLLNDAQRYKQFQHKAWLNSQALTTQNCYRDFMKVVQTA